MNTNGTAKIDLDEILQKRQSEIQEMQHSIATLHKSATAIKPHVQDYNDKMKKLKEYRRALSQKQKEMKIVASFFEGTSIFDARFPLFAQQQEQSTVIQNQ